MCYPSPGGGSSRVGGWAGDAAPCHIFGTPFFDRVAPPPRLPSSRQAPGVGRCVGGLSKKVDGWVVQGDSPPPPGPLEPFSQSMVCTHVVVCISNGECLSSVAQMALVTNTLQPFLSTALHPGCFFPKRSGTKRFCMKTSEHHNFRGTLHEKKMKTWRGKYIPTPTPRVSWVACGNPPDRLHLHLLIKRSYPDHFA